MSFHRRCFSPPTLASRRAAVPPQWRQRHRARGFSLLEITVVLVIIGVVLSAVSVGTDLLRNARGQKTFSSFVMGWQEAFSQYTRVTGRLPGNGKPPAVPTSFVARARGTPHCGQTMVRDFLEAGVRVPQGNGHQREHQYLYQDSGGSPRWLEVCFMTVSWAVRDPDPANAGAFVSTDRHVMRLTGLTAELALQMDVLVDGGLSARFGQFRSVAVSNRRTAVDADWGDLLTNVNRAESARREVPAYFEMY